MDFDYLKEQVLYFTAVSANFEAANFCGTRFFAISIANTFKYIADCTLNIKFI